MKYSIRYSLLVILLLVSGCASSKKEAPSGKEEAAKERASSSEDIAVRQAIVDAFNLEHELSRSGPTGREQVLSIFRKGFHEQLAVRLTNYYWLEDESGGMIRATEPLFLPPERIEIVKREPDHVATEIRYEGNAEGPNSWPTHVLEVVVKKEGAVWKIFSITPRSTEQAPDGTGNP